MAEAPVVVTQDGAVATVMLNRPEKRNALDTPTVVGVKAAMAELGSDPAVRVIVLTGAGPDFCAGADLEQLERIAAGADAVANLRDAQALGDLFSQMRRLPKPVVGAIRGRALAGGAGLAAACDMVLAADDAALGYPEVHLGFVPAMVMALLRRTVGEKLAFELVARGDPVTAPDALRMGLINRVLPAADFDAEVRSWVHELATRSASALALTKRLLYGMDGLSFEEAIARGAEINALARNTEDCRVGVRRFLDRQHGS
jgi:methylglutaconyl-CoA hydratase